MIRDMGINTPVIVITANAVTNAKEMLLAAGMNDFLSKPIMIEELYEILAKWTPGSKYVDAGFENAEANGSESLENAEFWKKLNEINGLSAQIGLERVSGQKNDYENILKSLITEIEKSTAKLNAFMQEEDMQNFEIEAHSMKSSLANVGAMDLSAKAHEVEIASSRQDSGYCAKNLQTFSNELMGMGKKLAEIFSELRQKDETIIISADLRQIMTKMKDFIKEMKYEEINTELAKLEDLKLEGSLNDEIEELKDAIMVMDYDSATEKIQKLLL